MNIFNRINNAFAAFNKTKNNVGVDPNHFLRHGARMSPKWSTPEIDDRDFYTGYGFAVINKRANRSVVLGKNFLYTNAKKEIVEKANKSGEPLVHPYLDLIRSSTDFSERDFWYQISTYLDLEGIYYLMAVRNVTKNRIGNVQKFVLMNPYNVRPITNSKGELGGYIEQKGDKQRQIPKEMVIPIKLLNPFDNDKAYSLADAARDSQYTLKQANDFAREAIDGNLNSPGILSSAIELPDDQFDNFVERVKNHGRGEPLFGNGSGTVTWVDMQTDLDKAALDKINSINRDTLLAISGLSKTGVGVEESGTGREVSRTQKDDFTENAIMPQIENIIDQLNLDYRKNSPSDWLRNRYAIALSNPLETNKDAEQADVDIRASQFDLMQVALNAGYSYDIAAKYAKGLVDITDLGEVETPEEPEDEPTDTPEEPTEEEVVEEIKETKSGYETYSYEGYPIPILQYLGEHASSVNSATEEGSIINSLDDIKTAVINKIVEQNGELVARTSTGYIDLGTLDDSADSPAILAKLNKRYTNQPVAVKKKIDLTLNEARVSLDLEEAAIIAENNLLQWYVDELSKNSNPHADLDNFIEGMTLPFNVYFTVMFPIYASQRVQQTASEMNIKDELPMVAMTDDIRSMISDFARKEATSHMNTIKTDIENALAKIKTETSDIEEIERKLAEAFENIQKNRSQTVSNNASARILNISNYQADLQFLTRAGLENKAYKVLESSTGDPCEICAHIINKTKGQPIPFKQAFAELGETITTDTLKMHFDFENIEAGNVHVNCKCSYNLIIED